MDQRTTKTNTTCTVGVLMGGRSIEREVSLNSGRTVCDHLDTTRYTIIPLFQTITSELYILPWRFLHRGKTSDFEHRLQAEAEKISWDNLKTAIDIIYIAMHGRYAEDGTIQGFLEVLQIPYVGSKVLASALGMNKSMQKDLLRIANIATPQSITVTPSDIIKLQSRSTELLKLFEKNNLKFPLFVKPNKEGSSLGITKVKTESELLPALKNACKINKNKQQSVLIEEAIEGMEFSCIIITDYKNGTLQALPPTEIVIEAGSDFFDYDQKYMPGRATKHTPARCDTNIIKAIQKISIQVAQTLGFTNIARIDGFVNKQGQIIITDPNSFSGLSPSSYAFLQAAEIGMTHTQLINHLIETELHSYGMLDALIQSEKTNNQIMKIEKKRIAILLGGISNEKEISLESGRNISYKLSPRKYATTPLFVNKDLQLYAIPPNLLVRNRTQEIEEALTPEMYVPWADLPNKFDFVFICLHGGVGENGSVQGTLEMLNVPYNGSSVLASALCIDKYKTNQLLKSQGFDIPEHVLLTRKAWQNNPNAKIDLTFPVIVKPHDDGCSVMVKKVNTQKELNRALKIIFDTDKEHTLIEEFITGMELTVGVIGNESAHALPPSQAVAIKGILSIEEKFLPGAGENQTPAQLPLKALKLTKNIIEQVYKTVDCKGYARIDCFYQTAQQSPTGKERVVIIEINTLPGMTPATCLFHQAAEIGIKPMDFIDLIVQLGFEEHTQQPHLTTQQNSLFKQSSLL